MTPTLPGQFNGYISRIPIYDERLNLYSYDLRFTSNLLVSVSSSVLADASDELLIKAAEVIDLHALVGAYPAFVTLWNHQHLVGKSLIWPKSQLILNLGEDIENKAANEILRPLKLQGYSLSFEAGFLLQNDLSQFSDASICSVSADVFEMSGSALKLEQLRKRSFRLLVRNVETQEQFDFFKGLQFDYFEGDYFLKPKFVQGTELPANRIAVLRLLSKLQNPDTSLDEVEGLISSDVSLSYKLLSIINAAYYGMAKKLDSVKRAIVLLGLQRIRNWAAMILFNAMDFRPRELLMIALVRARSCELIATHLGRHNSQAYYTAGLFSVLDAMMDAPIAQILEKLCLVDEINEALLYSTGDIGSVLSLVLSLELASCFPSSPEVGPELLMQTYLEGISWANEIHQQLLIA